MASASLPPSDLYERDYYTWIQEQVRALRERRVEHLDWPNLAEEIEDLEKKRGVCCAIKSCRFVPKRER